MTSKSPSTTRKGAHSSKLPPVHPGQILKETLEDLGLSMNRLAQEIGVPANRISAIVYWLNMQLRHDLETARDECEAKVIAEVRPRSAA